MVIRAGFLTNYENSDLLSKYSDITVILILIIEIVGKPCDIDIKKCINRICHYSLHKKINYNVLHINVIRFIF